jgi:hypothetical protein
MAKSKKIIINKLEIEIHELLVRDIEEVYIKFKDIDFVSVFTDIDFANFILDKVTKSKLTLDIIKNWTPSEVEEFIEAAKEVNSVFFKLLSKIVPQNLGEIFRGKISSIFTNAFSD